MYDVCKIAPRRSGRFVGKTVAKGLVDVHAALSLMRSFGNGYCVINILNGKCVGVAAHGILQPEHNFRARAQRHNDDLTLREMALCGS